MLYRNEEQRPSVLGGRNLGIALGVHVAFFALFFLFSALHGLFNKKETVIPIDLTVVVNENLDGEENEPPPLNNEPPPEPEPPKPKVETPPEPKIEHVEAVEQAYTQVCERSMGTEMVLSFMLDRMTLPK